MFQAIAHDFLADCLAPMDPIEHLAKALWLDGWNERGFLVATTVYADASGSGHDQPIMLVAGFFNSVTNWIEFGREWKAFLGRRGIRCLHQTGNTTDDQWRADPATRESVLTEAISIIERCGAVSMAHFTPTQDFNEWLDEADKPDGFVRPDAFTWNALRFAIDVDGYCQDRRMPLPEFVFESCSRKEQEALRDVMVDYGFAEPIFRAKLEDDPDRAVVALQAADFIAHEIFKGWKDLIADRPTVRPYLDRFSRVAHYWHWADKAKLVVAPSISAASFRLERIARGEKV